MRISDWSSDVCSSDLSSFFTGALAGSRLAATDSTTHAATTARRKRVRAVSSGIEPTTSASHSAGETINAAANRTGGEAGFNSVMRSPPGRSEEHTSELQSLMRISYAVFCLKKKKQQKTNKKR